MDNALKDKTMVSRKKIGTILVITIVVAVVGILFAVNKARPPKIDIEYFNNMLAKSSELTAAKWNFTGLCEYTDPGVKYINSGSFVMKYNATARAGINLNDVTITADNTAKKIFISIPPATVQDIKVDVSSIKYYNEVFAPFNFNPKDDNNTAVAKAESDAYEEAQKSGILEMANEQSATLIKGILSDAIPKGYVIETKQQ